MTENLQRSPQSFFWLGLLALIAFRLWFSIILPMTGDEAYFAFWGEHPAGGYYDHPPMVGWWLSGLLSISRSEWFLRLPALLLPLALGWCGWQIVRPCGVERAQFAASLILLQPANVWNVLITTDTPVILFSALSVLSYVAALRCNAQAVRSLLWHAVAGALLGLAFLGKYFAALLGFAYLIHALFVRRDDGRFSGLAVLFVAALPGPIYNLWWNSHHGWVNIVFNFINRNSDAGFSLVNPALLAISLIYLATPWVLLSLWYERKNLRRIINTTLEVGILFWVALIPLAVFALMSMWRSVGLHWIAPFTPLFGALAALVLPIRSLSRLVRWSTIFAALHMVVIAAIASSPIQLWKTSRLYDGIVLTVCADKILAELEPYSKDYLFSMEGYSPAATLSYNARRPFAVFGEGSFHARQDDFETDWRAQDKKNILILRKDKPDMAAYGPFFEQINVVSFDIKEVRFYVILGRGFKYEAYRQRVLERIRDRFYQIPKWLPMRGCDFCDRYFPTH